MGEKQIHSFLTLVENIRNGNLEIKKVDSNKFKLILKGSDSGKTVLENFFEVFEKIFNQRIIAYYQPKNKNQCEIYIDL